MVRVKRRYILLNIKYKDGQLNVPSIGVFIKHLENEVAKTYGDFGVACLIRGCSVRRYDKTDGYMILQVRKGVHDMVMSVMPLISSIDKLPCNVTIVHLSGTTRGCLKHLKTKYIMNIRADIASLAERQRANVEKSIKRMKKS